MAVIDYLEYSGKIIINFDKVFWTFKPQSTSKSIGGDIAPRKVFKAAQLNQYGQEGGNPWQNDPRQNQI
jgi:hypothetical protein